MLRDFFSPAQSFRLTSSEFPSWDFTFPDRRKHFPRRISLFPIGKSNFLHFRYQEWRAFFRTFSLAADMSRTDISWRTFQV